MDQYRVDLNQMEPQIRQLKNYLDSTEPKTKREVEEYNQKVGEYNNLVKSYNNKVDWLKEITAEYNSQVRAYNACLGS